MLNVTIDIFIENGKEPTAQERAVLAALTGGQDWPPTAESAPAPVEQAKPEQKPARKKRGPKPKTEPEPVEDTVEPAEPEQKETPPEAPATTTEPDTESAGPSFDDVRKATQDALMDKRHDEVRAILEDLGAARATEIPEAKRAEYLERLNRAS